MQTLSVRLLAGGSAAADGRLQEGHIVTHVNGHFVRELSIPQVFMPMPAVLCRRSFHLICFTDTLYPPAQIIDKIKGPQGSLVKLDILQDGDDMAPLEVELVRKPPSKTNEKAPPPPSNTKEKAPASLQPDDRAIAEAKLPPSAGKQLAGVASVPGTQYSSEESSASSREREPTRSADTSSGIQQGNVRQPLEYA